MTDYLTNDTDLTAVADAIRDKGGTTAALTWPTGYVDAISAISGGAETYHFSWENEVVQGWYTDGNMTVQEFTEEVDVDAGVVRVNADAVIGSIMVFTARPSNRTGLSLISSVGSSRPTYIYQVTG